MNELSEIFLNISDNQTIKLQENKVYHVYQDDSFEAEGYYCSNTAKKHENPNGLRRTAIFLKNKKNIVIRNLTVDYACPTMSEFKIISNNDGVCVIKINSECLYRIEYNDLIWQGEKDKNGVPYWEDSYIGNRRHIKLFDPETNRSYDFRRDDLEFENGIVHFHRLSGHNRGDHRYSGRSGCKSSKADDLRRSSGGWRYFVRCIGDSHSQRRRDEKCSGDIWAFGGCSHLDHTLLADRRPVFASEADCCTVRGVWS